MMKRWLLLGTLCAFTAAVPLENQGSGCKVFRIVNAGDVPNGIEKLRELSVSLQYDFWTDISTNQGTDIFVPSEKLEHFQNFIETNGFTYSTMIEDVGALLLRERASNKPGPNMDWENYHRYETIRTFAISSAFAHSDIAFYQDLGKTVENRSMIVIKIGRPVQNKTKPAIFMDGGIHAREWISPAMTSYFIDQLLNNYTYYEDLLSQVDFYIVPVANPDGYEYTHTDDRWWRKNRRPDPECAGIDLNRNFDNHWGDPGSSDDKCSEIYRGSAPFSEPESENIRRFIEGKKKEGVNWAAYYSLHSYSQLWLLPWGWTNELPENYEQLEKVGKVGVEALAAVHGTQYVIRPAGAFDPVSGASQDWAIGSGIFKYSQSLELRDKGEHGFLLPPEQIIPSAQETWAAIQASAKFIAASEQ